jgi:hypothetical protein
MRMTGWRTRIGAALREARVEERGAITAEWVVVVAVLVLAAVGITAFLMESADGLAGAIDGQLQDLIPEDDG